MSAALDFALVVFKHTEGAEQAYARIPRGAEGAAWMEDVALVEHHHHDRLVIRGVFAGHYVDADDATEFIGKRTAQDAVAAGVVGSLFGPPGAVVGLVGGGIVGSISTEHAGPKIRSALFDELRREVPEDASAVILLAPADEVDAMVDALESQGGRVVRHSLSADDAKLLTDAVAGSPTAAPRP